MSLRGRVQSIAGFKQEGSDLFRSRLASKQQHPAPRAIEFAECAFQQLVFQLGM